jgi:hypothetical protein
VTDIYYDALEYIEWMATNSKPRLTRRDMVLAVDPDWGHAGEPTPAETAVVLVMCLGREQRKQALCLSIV